MKNAACRRTFVELHYEISMITDAYSGQHSSATARAVAFYEEAVANVAAHRPAAAPALTAALAESPDFIAAHALRGFAGVILARDETMLAARDALRTAEAFAAAGAPTRFERAMLEALAHAAKGELLQAAQRLDMYLIDQPHNFLGVKLSHAMRFMSGDLDGMLKTTGLVLNEWSAATPGYGFLLGCHAFGLEEAGDYAAAETLGRAALTHEPTDAWGLHAVSHVFEMGGRTREGIQWLEATRPVWTQCNNFSFHMGWHLCLFHLAQGRHDLALDIYDREVRPASTEDFRDVVNAVSLLWRMRQDSVDVGNRWHELHAVAQRRKADTTLMFTSLHHMLTMMAVGDRAGARSVAREIALRAASQTGDQARVAAGVGADLAQALLAPIEGGVTPDYVRIAACVQDIGGSHAQRDVFYRTLILMAATRGDRACANALLAQRRQLRRDDRFVALALNRLNFALKADGRRAVA
jgi:hypothetical protein